MRVWQPLDAVELAVARGALEDSGIPFYIENENYFLTGGGMFSHGDTEIWVCAPDDRADETRRLLEERVRGA